MSKDPKQPINATLARLRRVLRELLRSEQGPKAAFAGAMLLVLMLAISGLNVLNSYVGRDFMSCIENRDMEGFKTFAVVYGLVFLASSLVAVFYRYMEEQLGILWRQQLTWRLTEAYLSERTYYRLAWATGVDNPDQRIADDVRAFTTTTLSFSILILNGVVTAISFSGVLWSISPLLFCVAVGYASLGTLFTILLGRPLIRLNYTQLDMEANFRADLIHVRENSDLIALAHREGRFKTRLKGRIHSFAHNFHKIITVNRNLGFFTTGYNYFIQLIPALFIAPLFIKGEIEFGVITQSAMAFATLLGAFSLIVTQFQSISAFTAVTARLQALSDAIISAHEKTPCSILFEEVSDRVVYHGVTLHSSDKSRLLLEEFTLEIPAAGRLLCLSKDDEERVALFRATAGVWNCGTGRILRPSLDDVLFLPERPYLPPGPLRLTLLRSGMENSISDTEIHQVLERLNLEATVQRVGGLDAERNWDEALSIGEQHMLSIARLFLAKPKFVFLDRPESSLPRQQILQILQILSERGIGVAVFSKNNDWPSGFDAVVELNGGGKWQLHKQLHADLLDLSC